MSTMLRDTILEHLRLRGRMTRSVSIARDLNDALALDGYIVTPKVRDTVEHVGRVLRQTSTQRAWRIVGPYGSGKSALGLFLCHLVKGPRESPSAFSLLTKYASALAEVWRPGFGWLPIVVSGARRPFHECLAEGLLSALATITDTPKKTRIFDELLHIAQGGAPKSNTRALINRFSDFAKSKDCRGLFLVFDEVGKCLEHAALHPDAGDLHALQELAELTIGNEPLPVAIVAMVHQHFEEYAQDLSKPVSDAWGKVSGRFQEISFDEPIDQYLALISETLTVDDAIVTDDAFLRSANDRVSRLTELQGNVGSKTWQRLGPKALGLYPLHPSCAIALGAVFKRFAQSERTLFAFLTEDTKASLRGYCFDRAPSTENWYDLANLFDYLAQGLLRFRNADQQRKWEFALHLAAASELPALETRIVKTIAVIECCGPLPGLSATRESVLACLDLRECDSEASIAISRLTAEQLIIQRRGSNELALAMDDAIRLELLQDEAAASLASNERLTYGLSQLTGRTAYAHRHYHATGTLRTFDIRYGLITAEGLALSSATKETDGAIVVLLISEDCPEAKAMKFLQASGISSDPKVAWRLFKIEKSSLTQLSELSLWTRMAEYAQLRNADSWTIRHIDRKLEEAEVAVRSNILAAVDATSVSGAAPWQRMNSAIVGTERSNISQLASLVADRLYSSAPRVFNEMINRDRPSTQIVSARQRLIEVMNTASAQEFLGIEGFPPEKAIYISVLQRSDIHRISDGTGVIGRPVVSDPMNVRPFWDKMDSLLNEGAVMQVAELLSILQKEPFGIRAGVAILFLSAYILAHRNSLVLFERGTLIHDPSGDHFARLFRAPQHFSLRTLVANVAQDAYIRRLARGVRLFANDAKSSNALELARVLARWNNRLSEYAKTTLKLSKPAKAIRSAIQKATDPVELFFDTMPAAVGGRGTGATADKAINDISAALDEISLLDRNLRTFVAETLASAFGLHGNLQSIRAALGAECKVQNNVAAEFRLKSFVSRCVDPVLTDDKWLESIAGLVTERSLENWTDDTAENFAVEIKQFAIELRRWLDLMLSHGKIVPGAERLVRIAITDGAGHEFKEVIHRGALSESTREKAIAAVSDATGIPKAELGPILASLFLDFAGEFNSKKKKKTHGE